MTKDQPEHIQSSCPGCGAAIGLAGQTVCPRCQSILKPVRTADALRVAVQTAKRRGRPTPIAEPTPASDPATPTLAASRKQPKDPPRDGPPASSFAPVLFILLLPLMGFVFSILTTSEPAPTPVPAPAATQENAAPAPQPLPAGRHAPDCRYALSFIQNADGSVTLINRDDQLDLSAPAKLPTGPERLMQIAAGENTGTLVRVGKEDRVYLHVDADSSLSDTLRARFPFAGRRLSACPGRWTLDELKKRPVEYDSTDRTASTDFNGAWAPAGQCDGPVRVIYQARQRHATMDRLVLQRGSHQTQLWKTFGGVAEYGPLLRSDSPEFDGKRSNETYRATFVLHPNSKRGTGSTSVGLQLRVTREPGVGISLTGKLSLHDEKLTRSLGLPDQQPLEKCP